MAINKDLWNKSFSPLHPAFIPKWPCPACGKASLALSVNSLAYKRNHTQYMSADFAEEDFGSNVWLNVLGKVVEALEKMQWIQHKFIGFLECESCGECVAVAGRAEIPRDQGNPAAPLGIRLYPEYFSPPLPFFSWHERYPESVRQVVTRSFGLAFSDAAFAAAAIRQAVEVLLDELHIPRDAENGSRLTLHNRIGLFAQVSKEHAKLLDAIRFIGNEGSHPGKIKRSDLIDAFEVLEHVLDEIFVRPEIRKKIAESSKGLADAYRPKRNGLPKGS